MKKFLIGLVAGAVLAVLTGVILLFALARAGASVPEVRKHSVLVLNVQGPAPERAPMAIPFPGLQKQAPLTLQQIRNTLAAAAEDSRIEAAVLFPRGVEAGWGKMQEIRSGLLGFKKSGKPLVAYLRNPSAREYYLATAADRIYMSREDFLNLKGLRIEAMYLRDTLDKLGIEVEIESAGKYKDAGDTLSRTSMSPETREVLNSLLDELYSHLLETIAESRGQSVERVRETMDDGPFLAKQAVDAGLADGLLYEDEIFEQLKAELGRDELPRITHRAYSAATAPSPLSSRGSKIAMIVGSGSILPGSGGGGLGDEEGIWARTFIRVLRQVKDDDSVKGVILRIDSPGGDAIASDEILREVRLLRQEKPMVVSMSDTAASGGYYMAMTGDPIIAYPNTFTGSIGVIYGKLVLKGLYDKIGLRKEILTRGRYAAIDSDYTPMTEAARAKLREGIDAIYEGFLDRVAEGRNREREEIEPLAEGRVWLGVQAHRNGLVDELGGLDRAIEIVKEKAGIAAEETVQVVTFPRQRSFWEYLMDQNGSSLLSSTMRKLMGGSTFSALKDGGILKIMPYQLEVR